MCLNPQTVTVKIPDFSKKVPRYLNLHCLRGSSKDVPSAYTRSYRPARFSELYDAIMPKVGRVVTVPCGRCVECLRARQDDLAVRCSCEAEHKGSAHFLTLTYNPESIPISVSLRSYDVDTGERVSRSPGEVYFSRSADLSVQELMVYSKLRSIFSGMKGSPKPKYYAEEWFDGAGFSDLVGEYTEAVFTPSLCRRDVRLWLKSSRVAYEREFGQKLPDFTYALLGEMGPKSCRPHYHMLLFGLSWRQADYLGRRWYEHDKFGFYKLKTVSRVNKDGSNGFAICAKYVSKYISKGEFDCQSVKYGLAERPRLQVSKHLGLSALTPNLVSYYRCDDLLGQIDQFSLRLSSDGSFLDRAGAEYLRDEVLARQVWTFPASGDKPGYTSRLPRSFIRKIWFFKDVYSEKYHLSSYRATPLRKALSVIVPPKSVDLYIDSILKRYPGISSGSLQSLVASFQRNEDLSRDRRVACQEQYLRSVYGRSIF